MLDHESSRPIWKAKLKVTLVLGILLFSIASFTAASFVASGASGVAADLSKRGNDLPAAAQSSDRVVVTLETIELVGQLADGVTYTFWTFNGTVPGPLIRLREGQTVEMHIKNASNSTMTHSIDSHAILGPGGGSVYSQTPPGQETIFQFRAMRAGLYVYHCATANIPTHLANGMYGLMLVEPAGGLPKVDREFYVVQGEIYTAGKFGEQGHQAFDFAKAQAEAPEYVLFNGRVGALTGAGMLNAKVGETVRIFFGNAGPNLVSSFHVIGGIFDRVYSEGALVSAPIQNVQTTLVPAGGSVMVEFETPVPGNLILVDHALFRINHGAVGIIHVEGPSNPDVFSSIKNATGQPREDTHTAQPTTTTSAPAGQVQAGTVEVQILNYAYVPAQITILAGTTVTWTNKDPAAHTVTEGKPNSPKVPSERAFDSANEQPGGRMDLMQQGDSYSFTFTKPGTYQYYCIPHPYMIGTVVVVSAQGSEPGAPSAVGPLSMVMPSLDSLAMILSRGWYLLLGAVVVGLIVGVPLGRRGGKTNVYRIEQPVGIVCEISSCKSLAAWRMDYFGRKGYYCDKHVPQIPEEALHRLQ